MVPPQSHLGVSLAVVTPLPRRASEIAVMAEGLAPIGVVVACDGGEVKTGIVGVHHFRGVKQCKRMGVLRGFNLIISALFGLVI